MSFRHPRLGPWPLKQILCIYLLHPSPSFHPSPSLHPIYIVQLPFFAARFCPPLIDALDAFNIALQRFHDVATASRNLPTQMPRSLTRKKFQINMKRPAPWARTPALHSAFTKLLPDNPTLTTGNAEKMQKSKPHHPTLW